MTDPVGELLATSSDLVVLEGLHAFKHAARFGATVAGVFASDPPKALQLLGDLAPDLAADFEARVVAVSREVIKKHASSVVHTGVLAVAVRPPVPIEPLAPGLGRPLVLLDDPRHLGNVGAVIRVAAAAGASGVLIIGELDPLRPAVVRGAAGLQYAIPVVARTDALAVLRDHLIFAFDAGAPEFDPRRIPDRIVMAFGSERVGLSRAVRARADAIVSFPMTPGVSSLNLSTAVAAALYSYRLAAGDRR